MTANCPNNYLCKIKFQLIDINAPNIEKWSKKSLKDIIRFTNDLTLKKPKD